MDRNKEIKRISKEIFELKCNQLNSNTLSSKENFQLKIKIYDLTVRKNELEWPTTTCS